MKSLFGFRSSMVLVLLAVAGTALSTVTLSGAAGGAPPTATQKAAASGAYGVDKPHTDITFTIQHMVVSKVRGRFNDFDGTVTVDAVKPEKSSVAFAIKTASIDTGNPQRDTHLKSADFFDAAKYPEITFKSTKVSRRGPNAFAAIGNLTIHGVSKQVVLPFTISGPVKGMEGALHLGVETGLKIDRRTYGLTWSKAVEGSALVGDQVEVAISLDLAKKPAAPAKTAMR